VDDKSPAPDVRVRILSRYDHGPGPTVFTGDDPARGIERDPNEFWTDTGKHVAIHDMFLVDVGYSVAPPPELRLVFDWWGETVPDEYAGPLVRLTFGDARILEWNEKIGMVTREPAGQVSWLDYRGDGVFWMDTFTLSIAFSARTCHVTTHERAPRG
jgi:hypothetical protein